MISSDQELLKNSDEQDKEEDIINADSMPDWLKILKKIIGKEPSQENENYLNKKAHSNFKYFELQIQFSGNF